MNVSTKMAPGGLSGFDGSAVFFEECRKPENDLARPVMIAAPLIALMYILGTSAVLAYVTPANVDLASPVGQVMKAGFGATGLGQTLAAISVAAFNVGRDLHPIHAAVRNRVIWLSDAPAGCTAAAPAFLIALVSLIFELLPPGDVANTKVFAIKVAR